MEKAEIALRNFESYNCAQSVLCAYAEDYGLAKQQALQTASGFGGGIGRTQNICGALSGAVAVLGLASGFREEDRREKINEVYANVRALFDRFRAEKGAIHCRDLLEGCDLASPEVQKTFKERGLKETCRACVRRACELLDTYR